MIQAIKPRMWAPILALLLFFVASPALAEEIHVFVNVDGVVYGAEDEMLSQEVILKEGATALDALLKISSLEVDVVESSYGPYVQAINGVNDPMGGWIYTINGESLDVGAGAYLVKDNDHVSWTFTIFMPPEDTAAYTTALADLQAYVQARLLDSPWHTIALAQSDQDIRDNLAAMDERAQASIDSRKWTDKERSILELLAAGQGNQAEVLMAQVLSAERIQSQGNNALIYGLLAVNAGPFDSSYDSARQVWLEALVASQNTDGSFSLITGRDGDVDMTAMALQALAPYQESQEGPIGAALTYLEGQQNADGSFSNEGIANAESTAQVILALAALGSDPSEDIRFMKDKQNPLAALLAFQLADGSFSHEKGGESDILATEQAHLALVAMDRFEKAKDSIWSFPNVSLGKDRFIDSDRISSWALNDVNAAFDKGLISGYPEGSFKPKQAVTRAEAMVLLARVYNWPLGKASDLPFKDLPANAWYGDVLSGAYAEGYAAGVAADQFAPNAPVDRQSFAVFMIRGYELPVSEMYFFFEDQDQIANWAEYAVQASMNARLMHGTGHAQFSPRDPITREQAALILNRLDEQLALYENEIADAE